MLTQERLKEALHYNPETGIFIWLIKSAMRIEIGDVAGSPNNKGYLLIGIDKRRYKAHRLAWLYMTGKWPTHQIDHENLCKSSNIWSNLREATDGQNRFNRSKYSNNTSGYKGVTQRHGKSKWRASIRVNKARINLGEFNSPEMAHVAYTEAAAIYHKEFGRAL